MKVWRKPFARFRGCVLLAACGVLAAQIAQAGFDFDEKGNPFCAGEALVTFKKAPNALTARSVMTRVGVDADSIHWFDMLAKFLAQRGGATEAQNALADQLARTAWVKFDQRQDVLSFCDQLKTDKDNVVEATPNSIGELAAVPNDFFYGVQWAVRPITKGNRIAAGVTTALPNGTIGNFPDAWNIATGYGVKIAVLDTGCDLFHGDLVNKIVFRQLAAGCLNSFAAGPDNPPVTADPTKPWDEVGHGTMVAGIIGAQWKNRKGIAGAAPEAQLMIIKVTNGVNCNPTTAALASGVSIAVVNGANIINMSLHTGGAWPQPALAAALLLAQSVGVVPVAAVGNYAPNPIGPPTATYPTPIPPPYPIPPTAVTLPPTGPVLTLPSAFPGVIAVGGHPREYDQAAYGWRGRYSYVTPAITLLGPGGIGSTPWHSPDQNTNWAAIFTTWPRYALPFTPMAGTLTPGLGIAGGRVRTDPADGSSDSYTFMDCTLTTSAGGWGNNYNMGGSSLGAAHVSGATALLKQKLPWFSPAQILARHIRFADRADLPPVVDANVPTYYSGPSSPRLNPFDPILFPPTTPSGRWGQMATLLINPPCNPYLGYGLLDAFRLVQGVAESPAYGSNVYYKANPPTGYVRVFPWSPRDDYYTDAGRPISTVTNVAGYINGIRNFEDVIPTAGANLLLRAIMVDDQANLLTGRNPQIVARFSRPWLTPLSVWVNFPVTSSVTLLDNGLGNDLAPNDGIYTGSIAIPAAYNTYPIRVQYFGSADGLLPNTNCIIHVRFG